MVFFFFWVGGGGGLCGRMHEIRHEEGWWV